MKGDFRAGLFCFAGSFQLRSGNALFVGLLPDFALAPDFQIEPVGKRVDDRNADAVQAAGNFVGVAIEFSAGVQHGHHDFGGGLFFRGVHVHGNAAAVVDHGDAVVVVHGDVDFVAVAGHGFVDGVVDDFPDEMVQAHFAGGTDVHRGALADGFEAAENFDGSSVVLVPRALCGRILFITHESCVSSVAGRKATWSSIGKAVARICSTLALPIGPALAKIHARAGTRRVFLAPSRPVPKFRGDAAKPCSPLREGISRSVQPMLSALVLAQACRRTQICCEPSAVLEDSGTLKFYRK